MSDLKIQGEVGFDTTKAEADLKRVEQGVGRMAQAVQRDSAKAGKAAEGVGDGFTVGANKITREEARITASIKRATTQLENLGKTASQKLEFKISTQGLDASKFEPALAKLRELEAAQDRASGGFLGMAGKINGALASVGVGVSLAGLAAFTKATIDGIDALNDLADATGSSIENLSALQDVARRTGTSLETVESVLIKFQKALGEAGNSDSAPARALRAIGLSVEDLKRQDPAEALLTVSKALAQFSDDGNKAQIYMALVGKSVKEAAPFFKDLAEQGSLVAKVTKEQAEESERFNKGLATLKTNIGDAARSITAEMLPALNRMLDDFVKGTQIAGGFSNAITLAFINPFKSAEENVKSLREELDGLNKSLERYKRSGSDTRAIEQAIGAVQTRLRFAEYQSQRDAGAGGGRGVVNPDPVNSRGSAPDIGAQEEAQKRAAEAAKKYAAELDAQQKLLGSLAGVNGDYMEQLTRLQAMRAAGNLSDERYLELVKGLIEQQPQVREMRKVEADSLKEQAKAADDASKSLEKWYAERAKEAEDIDKQIEKKREEIAAIGLTKEAAADLAAAKLDVAAAAQEEYAANLRNASAYAGEFRAAYEQAAADAESYASKLRSLAGLTRDGARKTAAADAAKETEAEWKKTAEKIEDQLTDALMRGFESGKGFARNLRDTVVNMFKTMVLQPVIRAIVAPVAGGVASMFGGPASASGLGGASGGPGAYDVFSMANALRNGSAWLTDFGGQVASTVGEGGIQAIAAGFDDLGVSLIENSQAIGQWANTAGTALGYLNAAYSLSQGRYGAAAGAAIGTYFGGPIGGAIGSTIGGALDSAFGGGGGARQDGQAGVVFDRVAGSGGGPLDGALRQQVAELEARYNAIVAAFGGQNAGVRFGIAVSTDPAGDAPNRIEVASSRNGQALFSRTDINVGRSAEELQRAIDDYAVRALVAALKATDLGTEFNAYLAQSNGTSSAAAARQVLDTIVQVKTLTDIVGDLGDAFASFTAMTVESRKQIIGLAGGIEALAANITTYYANFYSADEQRRNVAEKISSQLAAGGVQFGVDAILSATRAQFREMVEGLDLTTEAGRKAFAALMSVSGAFAAVSSATEQMAQQIREALISAGRSVAEEVQRLRGELTGQGGANISSLQAQFAITSAQARAGDAQALARLPQLSSAVERAAVLAADSALDIARVRGYLAGSLTQTLDSLGLDSPVDGSEFVTSSASVDALTAPNGSAAAMQAALAGLREDNAVQARTIVQLISQMNNLMSRWDADGIPETRATA